MTEYKCPSEIELEEKIHFQETMKRNREIDKDFYMFEEISKGIMNL